MSTAEQPPLITECPNCHTRFRVSESQLHIAHGRVRCGACLAVFPGMDYLLAEQQPAQPKVDRRRNSTLESVLTELSQEQARSYPEEDGAGSTADDDPEVARVLSGYDPALVKRDTRFEFAPMGAEEIADAVAAAEQAGRSAVDEEPVEEEPLEEEQLKDAEAAMFAEETDSDTDWMAASVDTTAMDKVDASDASDASDVTERPSFDDALEDEEALRWWLADELTGEQAIAPTADEPSRAPQVDKTTGESFDLEELILAAADGSAEKLEALLSELPTEMAPADKAELAAQKADAAPPRLSIEVPYASKPSPAPITEPVPNVPERIMRAIAKRKQKTLRQDDERVSTTEHLLADGALVTEQYDALSAAALAEARSHAQPDEADSQESAQESAKVEVVTPQEPESLPSQKATGPAVWLDTILSSGRSVRIGTACASLLLVTQIFYHQFDSWVEQPQLRPIYQVACSVLRCELPAQRALTQLSSRQLVVRQHPDDADLLLIDVLLVNEAEFDQPFPLLELNFMTARGDIAVTHEIPAADYLGGELRNSNALMPSLTPVHIDFAVPNPGPDAPSYQLAIR